MGTARACNMAKSLPVISLLFVAALALAAPTPTKNMVPTNEAFTSNSSNQDFPPCHFVAVSPCPAREPSSCYLGYMTAEGSTMPGGEAGRGQRYIWRPARKLRVRRVQSLLRIQGIGSQLDTSLGFEGFHRFM